MPNNPHPGALTRADPPHKGEGKAWSDAIAVYLKPRVLIFIEPTRGIDVNAKAGIYHLMRELARSGAAIMMISSDLPEILGVADQILVMREGRIVGSFARGASEAEIMLAATGEHLERAA